MGIFDLFKKKETVHKEKGQKFFFFFLMKYFNGSNAKLGADAKELLELTKYGISLDEMAALLIRSLGTRELGGGWNKDIANAMSRECSGKLPDVELKWLLVYCDLHYIHKNPAKEAILMFELAGRQIGMPSPHGNVSANYKFQ